MGSSHLKKILLVLFIVISCFVRLYNLDWGLPYPFHPDERNMVDAIVRLECPSVLKPAECWNPEFYAYGQAPLYVSALGIKVWHILRGQWAVPISFREAAISLRIQSVIYSLLTLWVLYGIMNRTLDKKLTSRGLLLWGGMLVLSIQPYVVQFAHFGTTEALLMLLYSSIVLVCLQLLEKVSWKNIVYVSLLIGLSVGIKVSSLVFAGLPGLVLCYQVFAHDKLTFPNSIRRLARYALAGILMTGCIAALTSPQNLIHWPDFMGSMHYEFGVGNGAFRVFYTRQFEETIPYLFQFLHVFPYSHGVLQLALFSGAFFLLPWRNARINVLRVAFLLYVLPAGMAYTKWARFMAPAMPLISVLAFLGISYGVQLIHTAKARVSFITGCVVLLIIPGLSYLTIYTTRDTRYAASEWMVKNISADQHVLLETGNVINLPIQDPEHPETTSGWDFTVTPFDFYSLDEDQLSRNVLDDELERADYIVIASRRVFANHTCLWPDDTHTLIDSFMPTSDLCLQKSHRYPVVNRFFRDLFNPEKYEIVQTFASPPRIILWDRVLAQFPDEKAEEAWTVFDHPTVRIYRKR